MNDQVIIALARKFANDSKLSPAEVKQSVEEYLEANPEAIDQAAIEAAFGDQLDGIEEDVGGLKSAVEDLQSGSLSALGAAAGQVPTADGDGSWQWTSPDSNVELVHTGTETDYPLSAAHTEYPMGITLIYTLASTSYPYGTGTVVTIRSANARGVQLAFGNSSNSYKLRTADSNGWSDWHTMGDFVVTVSGTTPTINAQAGARYVCGEVATISIAPPASGCIDVVFQSGSTPTVLTITPPTGVTVKWANGFDPTALEANTTYEINIMDGLGVAVSWT